MRRSGLWATDMSASATIIRFPERGGKGFSLLDIGNPGEIKLKHLDHTNFVPYFSGLSLARARKNMREIPQEEAYTLERTPELLLALAVFKALPAGRRNVAQWIVEEAYRKTGDEAAWLLSNALVAANAKGKR